MVFASFWMKVILAGTITHMIGQYLLIYFSFNITLVIVSILAYMFLEGIDFIAKYIKLF